VVGGGEGAGVRSRVAVGGVEGAGARAAAWRWVGTRAPGCAATRWLGGGEGAGARRRGGGGSSGQI